MDDPGSASDCDCKVGRMAVAYGVEELGTKLERLYVARGLSLRELADYFNRQLVKVALDDSGRDLVGDVDSIYKALSSNNMSADRRAEIRDQLMFADIDVDELSGDFVSHQTVRSHLQDCLGVDTSRKGIENTTDAREVIDWARTRDSEIIERVLNRLDRIDEIEIGDYEVSHSVRITCYDCGATYRPNELLEEGRCECETPTNER